MERPTLPAGRWLRPLALLALLAAAALGCSRQEEALRAIRAKEKAKGDARTVLEEQGAKFEEKAYKQGKAWSVDFSGVPQLPEDAFDRLRQIGFITELNFSNTNLTDDQLAKVNDKEIGSLLRKLDLSHTAVTDAGLEKLNDLFILGELDLTGTKCTPAGVQRFQQARSSNTTIPPMFKSVKVKL
jgi:hypothetical protein